MVCEVPDFQGRSLPTLTLENIVVLRSCMVVCVKCQRGKTCVRDLRGGRDWRDVTA